MNRHQGRIWYERAIYYQKIGDQTNAKKAYQMAQNYDPNIPKLPNTKNISIWRKLEVASLVMAFLCLLFIIFLLWQNPYLLSEIDFPWRIITQQGESTQVQEPKTITVTSPITKNLNFNIRSRKIEYPNWQKRQTYHLLRNALYYYLEDHSEFPKTLDQLVLKKYLRKIPDEPASGNNLVYGDFTDTGGWLYIPPAMTIPHRREEQIEVALTLNMGNLPFQSFDPLWLQVDQTQATLILMQGSQPVKIWPVSVGLAKTPTPIGTYRITKKNILSNREHSNPYGSRWIQLGEQYPHGEQPPQLDALASKGIGIHGTNDPTTIGTPNTQGCIRMRNEDVEELYDLIPNGIVIKIK